MLREVWLKRKGDNEEPTSKPGKGKEHVLLQMVPPKFGSVTIQVLACRSRSGSDARTKIEPRNCLAGCLAVWLSGCLAVCRLELGFNAVGDVVAVALQGSIIP